MGLPLSEFNRNSDFVKKSDFANVATPPECLECWNRRMLECWQETSLEGDIKM
jgi:hypothetical protein